ncbi:MAG TPA: hypothetical protein VGC77_12600 [Rhodopseudomonas sp.]|uniref:hypothetical protein n=1 Tax=Rhodopseudomonas sp. TaxID=1078 RepID=UPI002EDA028E
MAALVGIPQPEAARIEQRFLTRSEKDAGRIEVTPYRSIQKCAEAVRNQRVTAICIWLRAFDPAELVSFIGDVRVTHPFISFCLVGTTDDLNQLRGIHKGWQQRFRHYFKIYSDDGTFDAYVDVVRDLFVADAIKMRALGHYQTLPGGMVKFVPQAPAGFWIQGWFSVGSAITGAGFGALLTFLLSKG